MKEINKQRMFNASCIISLANFDCISLFFHYPFRMMTLLRNDKNVSDTSISRINHEVTLLNQNYILHIFF